MSHLGTDYSRSPTPDGDSRTPAERHSASYGSQGRSSAYCSRGTKSRGTRHFPVKNNQSRCSWSPSMRSDVEETDLTARNYHNSSFPSLISQIGPKQSCKDNSQNTSKKVRHENKKSQGQRHSHIKNNEMYFAESMRKRNETLWLRIQAVAEEKLAHYDQYAKQMLIKVRRLRERINRRSQELLATLARQEEQKKDDRFYDSSYGRIWRHHRTMQRRALNLEPMRKKDNSVLLI